MIVNFKSFFSHCIMHTCIKKKLYFFSLIVSCLHISRKYYLFFLIVSYIHVLRKDYISLIHRASSTFFFWLCVTESFNTVKSKVTNTLLPLTVNLRALTTIKIPFKWCFNFNTGPYWQLPLSMQAGRQTGRQTDRQYYMYIRCRPVCTKCQLCS